MASSRSVGSARLALPASGEPSAAVAGRVAAARALQRERFTAINGVRVNADAEGDLLETICAADENALALLRDIAARFRLSARGYHRVLRVARTIADLAGGGPVARAHVAEAAGYRLGF